MGCLYGIGLIFNDFNEIGVIFNTDGVSPFKSSCVTIWPVIIALFDLFPYRTYEQRQHDCSSAVGWKVKTNNVCFTEAVNNLFSTEGIELQEASTM